MESSRFFVANLPANTNEEDLKFIFQEYGQILNIEIKTKENLVDPADVKIIAFVTLNIGKEDGQYSLNDLNWQKVRGQKIKVSLAKESFLERLKREREEAKASNNEPLLSTTESFLESQSDLLKAPRENKRKTFDVDAELGDDEVAPELMISKKRAANSIHNGKIIIKNHDVKPIHVIETKHKKKKQMDSNASSADQKRKESLKKMKKQYQQNKIAIQKSLQDFDKSSKKIRFSDAESDQEHQEAKGSVKKSNINIFGADDDIDGEEVDFKQVHLGKKGEKLAKMQAKQSFDPRFRIDAKFVDDDDDDQKDQDELNANEDEDNERQWQINILEQVVGTKLDTIKNADKSQKNKKMLRYDPSKDEHQKFERTTEEEEVAQTKKLKKQQKKSEKDDTNISTAPVEVSKEVFYVVSDTLEQSLRTRGEGFSLLNMFGNTQQLEQRDEQLKKLGTEKILVNKNQIEKSFAVNPFGYDSSTDTEDEVMTKDFKNIDAIKSDKTNKQNLKQSKIAIETFFIPKNDIRLKEGAKFFICKKSDDDNIENYEEIRNRLKLLIKTKITKTKKNLANAGYKGKRKV